MSKKDAIIPPRATYRIQFHEGFPLCRARALVPYLQQLGISHLYASPLFLARPHSTHGYDGCDFNQLNPELGSEEELGELVASLRAHKMGLILDIVPNHMGIGGPENAWWWDVLLQGQASPFAAFFDIHWKSTDPRLNDKILLPVLGDRYRAVLEKGELKVEATREHWRLRYADHVFPLNEKSLQRTKASPKELNTNPALLDALIEQQYYRLAWHGCGDEELNYRRFFNITSLAGLRMEQDQVFNEAFRLTRKWLERGWLDGLRVDHPDGLADPEQFLQRLRRLAPRAWIVVEKILEPGEDLPPAWPVQGTTGYDFLNHLDGLFIDPAAEKAFTDLYLFFGGSVHGYAPMLREKKRMVLQTLLAAEVKTVTRLLVKICAADWRYRDLTTTELQAALIEWVAACPVYRTYGSARAMALSEADLQIVQKMETDVRASRPETPADLTELIGALLRLKKRGDLETEFVVRFQQLSSAAMAKGAEDTAFYCYHRFSALNEVGGDPGKFGLRPAEFHRFCQSQQEHWPMTQLASSTHDTKRSEDVRSRLALLSEMPKAWAEAVKRWSAVNKKHRKFGWPDQNAEYLFYQALVGAWPLPMARAAEYMDKAVHEAKEHTGWTRRNADYDAALRDFIMAAMADAEFMADLENFVLPLLQPACVNMLAKILIKACAPGVPDFYQGSELLDLSLVDPDNRRPVDFALRQQVAEKAAQLTAEAAWKEWHGGLPKLWLIQRVLKVRGRHPEWFGATARYAPLAATGQAADHVVAFQRGTHVIAVAPRLVLELNNRWRDTAIDLPPGTWRNELTREDVSARIELGALLAKFPVALLTRKDPA